MLDLFCGRGGWTGAFLARGWEVVGVDIVRHPDYKGVFIQQDVLELDAEFVRGFDFVCASSPCEQFSVHGMKHFHPSPPHPELGLRLFNHTREILEASGVPFVMENVRAAQQFVGRAEHRCGPFYLWGNAVPPLMPTGIAKGISHRVPGIRNLTRAEITAWRRVNDPMWSNSKSKKRQEATALAATIPPELAGCVADYAERVLSVCS